MNHKGLFVSRSRILLRAEKGEVPLDIGCLIFRKIQDDRLGLAFLRIFEQRDNLLFLRSLFSHVFYVLPGLEKVVYGGE